MLTTRALNRATLARQLLLRRHPIPAEQAVAALAGMQAQAPLAPYTGLWARLSPHTPADLSNLIAERRLVRAHLMRQTVHLVTARDYLDFRPLFAHLGGRIIQSYFAKDLAGADIAEVAAAARTLLAGRSLTRGELGKLLAQRWPAADPGALAYTATSQLAVVQVPPRGIWGENGQVALALAEDWLAPSARPEPRPAERLVLRYLAAFGPATVADAQTWSGLSRLREVTERLTLVRLRGEDGAELLDLPDAPRPDPDVPAPPRFLPEYDNLLLSYADRTRVIPHARPVPLPPGNGSTQGTLLIDGQWNATWKIAAARDAPVLTVTSFVPLTRAQTEAIEAEARDLLSFAAPTAPPIVRFATV